MTTELLLKQKTINNINELIRVISFLKSLSWKKEEVTQELVSNWTIPSLIKYLDNEILIKKLYDNNIFLNITNNLEEEDDVEDLLGIVVTKSEYDFLCKVPKEDVRKFLYFALIYSKINNHPSQWINYRRESFIKNMKIKGTEKYKSGIVQQSFSYGLELRVIGNKKPIICYRVNFRNDEDLPVQLLQDGTILHNYNLLFD